MTGFDESASAETEAAYLTKLRSRPRLRREQARDYLELAHNYNVSKSTLAKWNRDGEVVAAARAIGRALKNAGLDFHTLAHAIEEEAQPPKVIYRDRPTAATAEPDTWSALARWCRDNERGTLTAKEREFARDMASRLVCNGEPSEKQAAWLRAIYARLRKAV